MGALLVALPFAASAQVVFEDCLVARSAMGAEPVTIESLLREMTDPANLARLDDPSFTVGQFSSYDRKSVAPDQPGWFANGDGKGFIRTETNGGRTEEVMMEATEPGAIVRWWMTMNGPHEGLGTIRVYIDGEEEPRIQGNPFDLVSRGVLAAEPLSASVSPETWEYRRGHNLYLPIPYAESCKITFERVDAGNHYFLINYRQYEPGTVVESFTEDVRLRAHELIKETIVKLHYRLKHFGRDLKTASIAGSLLPGERRAIDLDGPAAIRQIEIKIKADDLNQALRSTVLSISFDGDETVWVPLGDFFGTGHQIAPYDSWYTNVEEDGTMQCYWVMPFENVASVSLHNLGVQPANIELARISLGNWAWDNTSLHFHSRWTQLYQFRTPGRFGNPPALDYNFVTIEGNGKYVGDSLTAYNYSSRWWGEGDEKIWVDDDTFPSHFGTGTEDYYGYAWCQGAEFDHPFIAQPEGAGSGMTRDPKVHAPIVNLRWRALDAIPFKNFLRFDMEIWTNSRAWINYAPTTFFYARPGAVVNRRPEPEQVRKSVPKKPLDVVPEGADLLTIEGEELNFRLNGSGKVSLQAGKRWQGERQLWWRNGKVGDDLTLEVIVAEPMEAEILGTFTFAPDYGKVAAYWNGKKLNSQIDFYSESVGVEEVNLGRVSLNEGINLLKFEIAGKNVLALDKFMVGLDRIQLTPVE